MRVVLRGRGDLTEWRDAARDLVRQKIAPRDIEWLTTGSVGQELFDVATPAPEIDTADVFVPKDFVTLAECLICHRDPARFDLCYRLLWRLQIEKRLLEMPTDPDMARARARAMHRAVHRDSHKMTAFVRFKEVHSATHRRAFVAWFEPDHYIVARTAGFFRRRFADMDWVIATPMGSAMWDGEALRVHDEPAENPGLSDEADDLWRTYFANIFNPARLKVKMMQTEMPKKYWRNLPEADLIPELIAGAEQRVRDMALREATHSVPKFHERLQERR